MLATRTATAMLGLLASTIARSPRPLQRNARGLQRSAALHVQSGPLPPLPAAAGIMLTAPRTLLASPLVLEGSFSSSAAFGMDRSAVVECHHRR